MQNFIKASFLFLLLILNFQTFAQIDTLKAVFENPPIKSRPYVYWFWMGSNFTKVGITKDLEAMKSAGIGGATILNISSAVQETHVPTLNNPYPEQTYRSKAYWEALKHAASEAKRLGLEIGLHNSVGYSTTGGPWIDEAKGMQKLVWSKTEVEGGNQITIELAEPQKPKYNGWGNSHKFSTLYTDFVVLAIPVTDSLKSTQIIDITKNFDGKNINWKAPQGKWLIYRFGYSPTGSTPHPLPDELIGKTLEVDKLNVEANRFHWSVVIDSLKKYLKPNLGKSFKHILIDSYEAGFQNWTSNFKDEFIKRKGYDPTPWLVSFSASVTDDTKNKNKLYRYINDSIQTKRFEWDYKDVISTLFYENSWKTAAEMLHKEKLELNFEPYTGPFNTIEGASIADLPMGEFWTSSKGGINGNIIAAARAAGKKVIGSEAFTGSPQYSAWKEDPAFLKNSTIGTLGSVNRLVLHHWVHQPFDEKYQPGMGMGWWGTHFSRYQTWFEPSKAFFLFIGRTQALLQRGEEVVDFVCLGNAQNGGDAIPESALLDGKVSVKEGKIVLSSGRKYAFLVLPNATEMLPQTLKEIQKLLIAGAIVVGKHPLSSPSLSNYPACDTEVKELGIKLWTEFSSKGQIFNSVKDVIQKLNITPDFQILKAQNLNTIRIVHRKDGENDMYFVANTNEIPQNLSVSFRISGKTPELWQAEDGTIQNAAVWSVKNGRTTVDFHLKALQSIFVVFRNNSKVNPQISYITTSDTTRDWEIVKAKDGNTYFRSPYANIANITYTSGEKQIVKIEAATEQTVSGDWNILFQPKLDKPFIETFNTLQNWANSDKPTIKYFAGTAIYTKNLDLDEKSISAGKLVVLDLGDVQDICSLTINGKNLGVLWYPPYQIDITDVVTKGTNKLEISVTNNWANCLIGDEQEPEDFEWGTDRGETKGRAIKAYPDWFLKNQPRPSQGRKGFTIWYYHRKDSKLQPAGLIGPVKIAIWNELKLY